MQQGQIDPAIQGQASQLAGMAAAREATSPAAQQEIQNKISGMASSTPPLTSGSPQSGKAPGSDPNQATAPNPSTGKGPGAKPQTTPGGSPIITGNVYLPQTTAQKNATTANQSPAWASALQGSDGKPFDTYDFGGGAS